MTWLNPEWMDWRTGPTWWLPKVGWFLAWLLIAQAVVLLAALAILGAVEAVRIAF